jgi:hypothetical protein
MNSRENEYRLHFLFLAGTVGELEAFIVYQSALSPNQPSPQDVVDLLISSEIGSTH